MKIFGLLIKWSVILTVTVLFCLKLAAHIQLSPDSSKSTVEEKIDYKICRAAKKYGGLSLSGQGGLTDIMLEKVRDKTYYFSAKEGLTLEKGREYLIKLALDILKIYNEDKLYRKHLFEYPFHTKNLDLAIFSKPSQKKDQNLPNISRVGFHINHLSFSYFTIIPNNPQQLIEINEPEYEEREIEEGFRLALNKVKNSLSPEQIATAKSLGLLDGNLVDERTCAHQEYRREILTKELWELCYKKLLREGKITQYHFNTDLDGIKKSNLSSWEKDIVFPDEKSKALYQKKIEYLKGEKEWEN